MSSIMSSSYFSQHVFTQTKQTDTGLLPSTFFFFSLSLSLSLSANAHTTLCFVWQVKALPSHGTACSGRGLVKKALILSARSASLPFTCKCTLPYKLFSQQECEAHITIFTVRAHHSHGTCSTKERRTGKIICGCTCVNREITAVQSHYVLP